MKMILPTLNKLAKAKVVILAHQSRPGKKDFISTHAHARELQGMIGRPVKWVNDIHGPTALKAIEEMKDGDILLLNNVRMDSDEVNLRGDFNTLSDSTLVQRLASVADAFVYDAFACAHRATPSTTGFTHLLPCISGELMRSEISILEGIINNPNRPCIAVLGGIKVDDSVGVADNMLRTGVCDRIWVTGGVANLFLEISGIEIGQLNHNFLVKELGKAWKSTVEIAKSLLRDFPDSIVLPTDVAANVESSRVDLRVENLPLEAPLFDIGINSIRALSKAIKQAGTVILNGPAGVFEIQDFALGTIEMLNACAESSAFTVIGGGHTATLVKRMNISKRMNHVSTGGGACLELLAGRTLPALAGLEASAKRFEMSIQEPIDNR
jgi:phosphoglycerate kinase